MTFTLEEFIENRPYLYHLTAETNVEYIRQIRRLLSTTELLRLSGQSSIGLRSSGPVEVVIDGVKVSLRDQKPLREKNIKLEEGQTMQDVVEMLDKRVFFWPGKCDGPIKSGENHFARYEGESPAPVILRLKITSLLLANPGNEPLFSHYNTGAPRMQNGEGVPRGPETFYTAARFPRTSCGVIEVTFVGGVNLPADMEWGPIGVPFVPFF